MNMKRELSLKNIKYGQLVEVRTDPNLGWESGYHTGMKVYFFNKKGVLVSNIYEFLPYDRIRNKEGKNGLYPRMYMFHKNERIKQWLYERICGVVTFLIKYTQSIKVKS